MKLRLVLPLAAILSTTVFAESYISPDLSAPELAPSEGLSTPETTQPEPSWSSVTEPSSPPDPNLVPLEGNTQAPAIPETYAPEPMPVPDTLEPQPFPEPNWDDIFGKTNDRPNPYSFPISPADREVAPFWVVDVDLSERVTPDEWQYFVHRLYAQAVERIEQGADSHAIELLHNIVGFHYQTLQDCINARIHEDKQAERVSEKDFPQVAQLIQSSCYVKFRYSLLAGPPPFEWIAKKNPTVTASQVEAWFRKRLAIAKHDVEVKKIVVFTPEEHEFLARVMDCTFKELENLGETPIHRDLFYQKTDEIEHCAHKD